MRAARRARTLAVALLCAAAGRVCAADAGAAAPTVRDFGARGDGATDDTAALQAAIDASYGKRLRIPRGDYRFRGPLRIEAIRHGTSALPIAIEGEGFDGNGGAGGTTLRNTGAGNAIEIVNTAGVNSDNLVVLQGFAIVGDGADRPGGDGILARRVNNLNLRDLWIQEHRESGVHLVDCWGASLDNLTLLRNRRHGLHLEQRFNAAVVRRVRAYANGRVYDASHANVYATGGRGLEHLGARFEQVDVSYAGAAPFRSFRRDAVAPTSTVVPLVRIDVARSVATATTAAPHGLAPGNRLTVGGATRAPNLARGSYRVDAVPTRTTFTFAVRGVADGVYAERTLRIQPSAFGLFLDAATGVVVASPYAEDCADAALLVRRVDGFEIVGGYFQNQVLRVEGATHGRISGAAFTGDPGGIAVEADGRHEVDVAGSNVFSGGAREVLPAIAKRDGRYVADAAPRAGTWFTGDQVWNRAPAAGGVPGWICVGGGAPGTWRPMAALPP